MLYKFITFTVLLGAASAGPISRNSIPKQADTTASAAAALPNESPEARTITVGGIPLVPPEMPPLMDILSVTSMPAATTTDLFTVHENPEAKTVMVGGYPLVLTDMPPPMDIASVTSMPAATIDDLWYTPYNDPEVKTVGGQILSEMAPLMAAVPATSMPDSSTTEMPALMTELPSPLSPGSITEMPALMTELPSPLISGSSTTKPISCTTPLPDPNNKYSGAGHMTPICDYGTSLNDMLTPVTPIIHPVKVTETTIFVTKGRYTTMTTTDNAGSEATKNANALSY